MASGHLCTAASEVGVRGARVCVLPVMGHVETDYPAPELAVSLSSALARSGFLALKTPT